MLLHLHNPPKAPYLILAGDIGRLCDYDSYQLFLQRHCAQFRRVFLVLGNHEFFTLRAEALEKVDRLQRDPALSEKLTVLNRMRIDIEDSKVTVLGCMLQTRIDLSAKDIVTKKVGDSRHVRDWTVEDHNAEHEVDVNWLKKQLAILKQEAPDRKVLVVTHYAPTFYKTSNPVHAESPLRTAFCTELLGGEARSWPGIGNVRYWVFGHTHWCTEFRIGGITVVANQRGYVLVPPGEEDSKEKNKQPVPRSWWEFYKEQRREFDIEKCIEI
ncbi:hypothetical protein VTN00DRAFT_7003 [Thermoascus crustaceus]|uniref:uncharacterized protein n=1 Tax=Thermoascus crustaceus TaxID=5088 RepID=UPI0037449987